MTHLDTSGTQRTNPYEDLKPGQSLLELAIQSCPWLTTDHMGERRYNYCTRCEGFVAGWVARHEYAEERFTP